MNKRSQVLDKAKELINGDRQSDYGPPEENFERIAAGWSIILGQPIKRHQVALCMAWVKTARLITGPCHDDSWVDAAGYVGLGAEMVEYDRVQKEIISDFRADLDRMVKAGRL